MAEPDAARVGAGRGAVAGGTGVLAALAVAELAAALFEGIPSALVAVGDVVIDRAPGGVERAAIDLLGTSDKLALNVGIVVVAVLVGGVAGALGVSRRGAVAATFAAFGAAGWLATLATPGVQPLATGLVLGLAVVVGVLTTRRLVQVAPRPTALTGAEEVDAARRRFLGWTVAAAATALVTLAAGRTLLHRAGERATRTVTLPPPAEPVRAPSPAAGFEEVEGLTPVVVDNDRFFRIDTRLVLPRIDVADWRLRIHGLVDREVELTFEELVAMPLVERYVTIACVSNEVGGELVGNAAWTGVPLADLLDRAGVRDHATQVVGRAVDGWTAGFPTTAAFDGRGAMLAVGMNGELLPTAHGFPARLVVPGLYGYVSATKWLTEIELTTWEGFDAYWVPRGWAKEGPVKTQSRIDVPRPGRLPAGRRTIAGVAWAPDVGIAAVEVRVDDGPWRAAEVSQPLSDDAWRQWRATWQATPGEHRIQVRATDADGRTQTEVRQPPFPDGATGWHTVQVAVT